MTKKTPTGRVPTQPEQQTILPGTPEGQKIRAALYNGQLITRAGIDYTRMEIAIMAKLGILYGEDAE